MSSVAELASACGQREYVLILQSQTTHEDNAVARIVAESASELKSTRHVVYTGRRRGRGGTRDVRVHGTWSTRDVGTRDVGTEDVGYTGRGVHGTRGARGVGTWVYTGRGYRERGVHGTERTWGTRDVGYTGRRNTGNLAGRVGSRDVGVHGICGTRDLGYTGREVHGYRGRGVHGVVYTGGGVHGTWLHGTWRYTGRGEYKKSGVHGTRDTHV